MKNKLKILIILTWVLTLNIKAQDSLLLAPVTIVFEEITADSAIHLLEQKINYNFTYNSNFVDSENKINVQFNSIPLVDILNSLITKDHIYYKIIGGQLVIYEQFLQDSIQEEIAIKKPDVYITVEGKIFDLKSKQPLPFANIGILNKSVGTVSNEDGKFLLKVHENLIHDTLVFNYLGYLSKAIPIDQITESIEVGLNQQAISLQEVIIRSSNPKTLVGKAIDRKMDNYPRQPFMIRSFYRESLKRDKKFMSYTEGLLDVYKSSYGPTIYTDQARLIKKRRYTNVSQYDTVMFRLKGGIQSSLALDLIKNPLEFMRIETLDNYSYHLSDIIVHNGKLVYLIDFHEKKSINDLLYSGTLYIDISTLAIVKINFGISSSSLKNAKRSFIVRSSPGINARPVTVNYEINYREIKGKYYVNHIRGELKLKVKKRGKMMTSVFETSFEMISTDIDTINIQHFAAREKTRGNMVFSDWDEGYAKDFWENENFIIPEDDLAKALSRFKETELVITK